MRLTRNPISFLMNNESCDGSFFRGRTARSSRTPLLYKEFMAEREEILKHKWIESEKAGADIGFEKALLDWIVKAPFELATKTREGRPGSDASYRLISVSSFKAILRGREGRHERKKTQISADKSILGDGRGAHSAGALRRIAHEIIERNPDLNLVILAGIPSRGSRDRAPDRRDDSTIEKLAIADRHDRCLDAPRRCRHADRVTAWYEASDLPLPLENENRHHCR